MLKKSKSKKVHTILYGMSNFDRNDSSKDKSKHSYISILIIIIKKISKFINKGSSNIIYFLKFFYIFPNRELRMN